ncbi:MAG: RnfABCDGE type electron transport complex subunit D [Chitinivibrionia bacterium]|nr:RnfABCDGE type electron transport complex subunit D [Chitinivibrionia bacterium]
MTEVNLLHISSSPHIRNSRTVPKIMLDVIIALMPAMVGAVMFFGVRALFITLLAVATAVITEHIISVFMMKRKTSIGDLSAVITGILLAFNLPVAISPLLVIVGTVFAIGVAKMAFGGLGCNFINPALAGRAFLMASYPAAMTGSIFAQNVSGGFVNIHLSGFKLDTVSSAIAIDGISEATPLAALNILQNAGINLQVLQEALVPLFWGNVGGTIGETSAFALLLGGIYLILRKVIHPIVPLIYIGGIFLIYWLFSGSNASLFNATALTIPTFHILSGGIFLAAFFMITDMTTTPITIKGQALFAAGCAVITVLIRSFGGYPEGASYAILFMNLLTPLIDRYVRPKVYGTGGKK